MLIIHQRPILRKCYLFFRTSSTKQLHSQADVRTLLGDRIRAIILAEYGSHAEKVNVTVTSITNPTFGDYQCNVAMPLAKYAKKSPKELAENIIKKIDVSDISSVTEVAGQGFINFRLSRTFVAHKLGKSLADCEGRLNVPRAIPSQKVVIDYSSPNIAKDMHVGHLRSTVLGDCLARLHEFLGNDVLRLNHVGDWGTQFGMLIEYMALTASDDNNLTNDSADLSITNLADVYRRARQKFTEDPEFQDRSRQRVVALQDGDDKTRVLWHKICRASRQEFGEIYDILGVDKRLEERGESFYNDMLDDTVAHLVNSKVAVESGGAICIFPVESAPKGKSKKGNKIDDSPPLIIRKSDGASLYATTDLAALRHRCGTSCNATRVMYVTDLSQADHFAAVFDAGKRAGFVPNGVSVEHIGFGLVLGEDGKKIKTREGDPVRLRDLLEEAVTRAKLDLIARIQSHDHGTYGDDTSVSALNRNKTWSVAKIDKVAKVIGIGSVKYADLCMNREGTYKFSYEKMLSLNGNTAPYLIYAYVRLRGIHRKALQKAEGKDIVHIEDGRNGNDTSLLLEHKAELALGVQLLRFGEILHNVAEKSYPNRLCDYLFELSQNFNSFYEQCSVLHAETSELRMSRLALCSLTADTLKTGLGILGIDTVEEL